MRKIKEDQFEKALRENGYINYYLEDKDNPNSYIFDSTKTLEIAKQLGIKHENVNDEYIFIVPKGTKLNLIEVINDLKLEVLEGEYIDNAIEFLLSISMETVSIEELEEMYEEEEGIRINFVNTINNAILTRDPYLIVALLDFINSCGDVHYNLYTHYNNNGELYYCDKCGDVINMKSSYKINDDSALCHCCNLLI